MNKTIFQKRIMFLKRIQGNLLKYPQDEECSQVQGCPKYLDIIFTVKKKMKL